MTESPPCCQELIMSDSKSHLALCLFLPSNFACTLGISFFRIIASKSRPTFRTRPILPAHSYPFKLYTFDLPKKASTMHAYLLIESDYSICQHQEHPPQDQDTAHLDAPAQLMVEHLLLISEYRSLFTDAKTSARIHMHPLQTTEQKLNLQAIVAMYSHKSTPLRPPIRTGHFYSLHTQHIQ